MSGRHRFFGNEYRSPNSQFSPEMPVRSQTPIAHRADNSRGNPRRFHSKSFPPPKPDIFVEAGRLAVDYLISRGLLPSNVCSASSSRDGSSSKISNASDFRDPAPPIGRGRPEQDLYDHEASGRQRRLMKSPSGGSYPLKGDHSSGELERDESSSTPVKANENASLEVGTDDDPTLSTQKLQQDVEDAESKNMAISNSALPVKDEAVAAVGKLHNDSASSMSKDVNDLSRSVKMDMANDAFNDTPVQNYAPRGGPAEISVSKVHNSMDEDKSEKRALEDEDMMDNTKKVKTSVSVSPSHENMQLSQIHKSLQFLEPEIRPAPGRFGIGNMIQKENLDSVPMHSKGGDNSAGPSLLFSEEKQLFPSSFRICDLNLMEASESNNENHDNHSIAYSSVSVPRKHVSVDVDLSMGNNGGVNNEYNKFKAPDKALEVIDLEGDSSHADKSFQSSMRRVQSGITGLESFPNHVQNPSYNPDSQDGYGLMISELMGNDIPNCPPGQLDINTLHSDMGLHHGDGLISDDDPIYMSLGEIPSLLRGWDQSSQDYGKSF